jgi:hypothetical protein
VSTDTEPIVLDVHQDPDGEVDLSPVEQVREALKDLDMKGAVREAMGRCPKCRTRLVRGHWLRWCPSRTCQHLVGPA